MYIPVEKIDQLIDIVANLKISDQSSLLLLIGEESSINYEALFANLNELGISFFGGIFPGIINEQRDYKSGIILKVLPHVAKPVVIQGWEDPDFEITPFLKDIKTDDGAVSFFTIVDGLTSEVTTYLQKLYHYYGNAIPFMGAGAGSISLVQQPCVFTNDGMFQDAAVLFPMKLRMNLGVKHGWEKLAGPLVATRTENNIIHELNWKNAFEVYREIVEKDAQETFTDENFFAIAKGYPIGKIREIGEDVCRVPLSLTKDGSLVCLGRVPENTVLYIMKGDGLALVESAETAVKKSMENIDTTVEHTLVVDCISRALFLEKDLSKELAVITKTMGQVSLSAAPQGVLSLGEISSGKNGFLEFYNKTLVIGALTK